MNAMSPSGALMSTFTDFTLTVPAHRHGPRQQKSRSALLASVTNISARFFRSNSLWNYVELRSL